MRINLLSHTFYPALGPGGPIFSTYNAAKELAKLGVDIFVSTTDCDSDKPLNVRTNQWVKMDDHFYVKYYKETILGKFSSSQLLSLWKDVSESDIVHIQGIFNLVTPIGLLYAKIFRKPVMLSPRGALGRWCLQHGNKLKKIWLFFLIKPFARKIIWHVTSSQENEEIIEVFPNVNCAIIPNGINLGDLAEESDLPYRRILINKFSKIENIKKVIVSMGRLEKKKGFDILINAFFKTLDKYPDCLLLIAGRDEGEMKNLLKLIKDLDIENNVVLVGQIDGELKNTFFSGADLFVLPSHNENFGNVYAESLAAGTPIVASTNTPWREVETAGCGKWVPNTIEETKNAMIQLLENEIDDVRQISKNYVKKFDWRNIAQEFKKTYEGMM